MIYGTNSLTNIDLANLNVIQGIKISGGSSGDYSGRVSGLGDFNKDLRSSSKCLR